MKAFGQALGSPWRHYPIVHVAGTNGKGSVCAMVEACLRRNGCKTGLFTSPHLIRLGERIRIDGKAISDDEIVGLTEEMREAARASAAVDEASDLHPTFFEFMAAMAFVAFSRAEVDVAVVETGLGGRLDATNVVAPAVSALTTVALDHCEILGADLASIAREKAGILKPGRPVVIGGLPDEAEKVVREIAQERGCAVFSAHERFPTAESLPETSLAGGFQRRNAALALSICETLAAHSPLKPDPEVCRKALLEVNWPGRWQTLAWAGRTLILDATHNAEGAAALEENLASLPEKPVILAGTLGEDRATQLMPAVALHAREIRLLVPDQPRACSHDVLEKAIPAGYSGEVRRSTLAEEIPAGVRNAPPGVPIVITGSIYLVGEALARLREEESPKALGALQDWV